MIRNLYYVTSDYFYQNRLFDLDDIIKNDYRGYEYYLLKNKLLEYNINVNTYDFYKESESNENIFIFNGIPEDKDLLEKHRKSKMYLVRGECEVIKPENWDIKYHKYFYKIFTWNDDFIDNKRYYKLNFSNKIPSNFKIEFINKKKLCVAIVGNKYSLHPNELYSERLKAILWFEKEHPNEFDFYGTGWDKKQYKSKLLRKINGINIISKITKPRFKTYRGAILNKKDILTKYKYSICFENAKGISGYITEKLFDCFFSGCIPIYLGAPNVTEHIPENIFIDMRNFRNYNMLYQYLKGMKESEYFEYLENIERFVNSDKIFPFSSDFYVETIVNEIIN